MTRHTENTVLRSLDAAAPTPTAGEQERTAATLDRIVATPPPTGAGRPAPDRRSRRRWVLVPTAVLALTLGTFAVQSLGGGDPAYASWTATPEPVAAGEFEAVASACRGSLRGSYLDVDIARLVLAERRGEFVVLLYRTDDPDMSGSCLVHNPERTDDVEVIGAASGGSSGPAQKAPAGSFTEGSISQHQGASVTDGAVGPGVTGVTIHAGTHTVTATVQDGRYTAWWPGRAFEDGPPQPSGKGGPEEILTYDLTLDDGTVVRDAQPARPS